MDNGIAVIDDGIAVIDGIVDNILTDTAAIGVAGAGLTNITDRLPTALTKGTADSGTSTTLRDTALSQSSDSHWPGQWLRLTSGSMSGQVRLIIAFENINNDLTVTPAFSGAVSTETYEILPAGGVDIREWLGATVNALVSGAVDANVSVLLAAAITQLRSIVSGTSDSGTTTTMVDSARSESDDDYWNGSWILFTSGNISGQCRRITDFVASTDTITFEPATTQAVNTQTYEILPVTSLLTQTEHLELRQSLGMSGSKANTAGGDIQDIQTRLPAALASGKIVADSTSIGGVAGAATQLSVSAATMVTGTVDTGSFSSTTTQFEADDITEATTGHFNGRSIIFTSGALQVQATEITAYTLEGSNGRFTVVALTEAPADNVTFIIV